MLAEFTLEDMSRCSLRLSASATRRASADAMAGLAWRSATGAIRRAAIARSIRERCDRAEVALLDGNLGVGYVFCDE